MRKMVRSEHVEVARAIAAAQHEMERVFWALSGKRPVSDRLRVVAGKIHLAWMWKLRIAAENAACEDLGDDGMTVWKEATGDEV